MSLTKGPGDKPGGGHVPGRSTPVLGFTLIELLVTIAVLAILIALAVPSFTSLINSNRLAAQSNEIVASLQVARMEAVKQNRRTTICRSTAGNVCTAGAAGDTWTRWITYVDLDNSGGPAAGEVVRVNTAKVPVQVRSTASALTFRADGMVRDAAGTLVDNTFTVCIPTTQPAKNKRVIGLATGSRIAVTTPLGTGVCP
ncbi:MULTISPECIES: GspH/FimT family pseudopilin [unclassified Pseudoxanthomonas]|uniref:GspH/FimT family pseudopilin n=1 Tax=unclassified Pseudoxanthomonas TaxID=2645906 RepID=UPI003076DF4B